MSFPRYPKYKPSGVEWLGEVPEGWEVVRLKRAAVAFPSNVDKKSVAGEEPVVLCNYTDVYKNDRIVAGMDFMQATATSDQIAKFTLRAGDTIITKDSETADDIAIAAFVPDDLPGVVCGYHLTMVRPRPGADGAYIKRLFDSAFVKASVAVRANGLTRVGLGQYDIDNLELPLPPLPEQAVIAAFLDRETGKIDALVAEQERLIELLREKRQAVISHAVTKGLNPKAPMKDSGIEWLGEVPAHWELKKLGYIATCKSGAGFPDEHQGQTENNIPFFKGGDPSRAAADGALRDCAHTVSEQTAQTLRARVFGAGTIVFAKVGAALLLQRYRWLGRPACIDNNMMGMSLEPSAERAFALLLLPLLDLNVIVNPGAVPSINESQISAQRVALPPLPEQRAIVVHLERETAGIDALLTEAQRAIELLQERRSALISAAVTGQIDVRKLGERAA